MPVKAEVPSYPPPLQVCGLKLGGRVQSREASSLPMQRFYDIIPYLPGQAAVAHSQEKAPRKEALQSPLRQRPAAQEGRS